MKKTIMNYSILISVLVIVITLFSCLKPVDRPQNIEEKEKGDLPDWKAEAEKILQLFGHRNWIVVSDAAYPQQSNPAIKTIAIKADQVEVVKYVYQLIEKSSHVKANICVDMEMDYVEEKAAEGIENYKSKLYSALEGVPIKKMMHEDIIQKIDASAKLFNVLVLKTDFTIPYTSVFFELECGYWDTASEENLRKLMFKNEKNN